MGGRAATGGDGALWGSDQDESCFGAIGEAEDVEVAEAGLFGSVGGVGGGGCGNGDAGGGAEEPVGEGPGGEGG